MPPTTGGGEADAETDESFIAGKPEHAARAIERALTAGKPPAPIA